MSSGYLQNDFAYKLVTQKGSGAHVILGILILLIGIGVSLYSQNDAILYLAMAAGNRTCPNLSNRERPEKP